MTHSNLSDRDAIGELKARYCRLADTKQWSASADLFTKDFVLDTSESGGHGISGFGHHTETYTKCGDQWRIASSKLSHLLVEMSVPQG